MRKTYPLRRPVQQLQEVKHHEQHLHISINRPVYEKLSTEDSGANAEAEAGKDRGDFRCMA